MIICVSSLAPILLTSAREWPVGGDWVLEPKWDGYRLVASVEGGRARCWTRHGTELTSRVGALADELVELLPDHSVIDGELVVLARGPGGADHRQDAPALAARTAATQPKRCESRGEFRETALESLRSG
jgi:ATP-dependent DNA ligase